MIVFLNTLHSAKHYENLMVREEETLNGLFHFRYVGIVKFIVDLFLQE